MCCVSTKQTFVAMLHTHTHAQLGICLWETKVCALGLSTTVCIQISYFLVNQAN